MKKIIRVIFISVLLILCISSCVKKNNDYDEIKTAVEAFTQELVNDTIYDIKDVDLSISSEGGVATGYFQKNILKSIEATILGEMGQIYYDIYYVDNSLTYFKVKNIKYDQPIYMEDSTITEEIIEEYVIYNQEVYTYNNKLVNADKEIIESYLIQINNIRERLINEKDSSVSKDNSIQDRMNQLIQDKTSGDLDKVVYSEIIDIDNDNLQEAIIVFNRIDPNLWYINSDGVEQDVTTVWGEYKELVILQQGNEKHILLLSYFEPSNTQLEVFSKQNSLLKEIFSFTADWDIEIANDGFNITWKKYTEDEGYELQTDSYVWSLEQKGYIKN